jgi:hypothetical protein
LIKYRRVKKVGLVQFVGKEKDEYGVLLGLI